MEGLPYNDSLIGQTYSVDRNSRIKMSHPDSVQLMTAMQMILCATEDLSASCTFGITMKVGTGFRYGKQRKSEVQPRDHLNSSS